MNEALSTMCILEKYPALKLTSVVSKNIIILNESCIPQQMVQEMEIIINRPDIYKSLALDWKEKGALAILIYARN